MGVRTWGMFWALVVAVGAWTGTAGAEEAGTAKAEEAQPAIREPSLRKIDWKQDVEARKRINYYRNRLPGELRRQNNFAWARADIPGLRKKEFYAHSRIQNLDGLSSRAAKRISGISPAPARGTGRFQTLFVDFEGNIGGPNAIPRWFDTEYKIMEDLAARLPDPSVEGRILLFTELEPCLSCWGVMQQFLGIYTNIEMDVLYNWP
jgi:hypothetical protein